MCRTIALFIFLFCQLFSFGQEDYEIFRGTFYSNFFGFKMKNLSASSDSYFTTVYYQGKKLDKPRNYELYGQLSRELQGVEFKYKLVEAEAPENLDLIKTYFVHVRNDSKYAYLFDTIAGDWISDSTDVLDSLITLDIRSSSINKANEIGIYFHKRTGKYYLKSDKYCALVKIKVTSRLKGKHFLKKYHYDIDKREMCQRLLSFVHYCDYNYQSENDDWDLDLNCYDLYKK